MKRLLSTIMFLACLACVNAAPAKEDLRIELWNNTTAKHSNGLSGEEVERAAGIVKNVTQSELYIYVADREKSTGQAVVICPGGGYTQLSVGREGTQLAEWFASNGITAAVLKYRLPNGVKEVPFEDAELALRVMRQRSRQLGYDYDKVGIVGSSAGGHLAAWVSTMAAKETKPNFTILFYPVITGQKGFAHEGSFNQLLGKDRTTYETNRYSLESAVDGNTPPAIIVLSDDDKAVPVESSLRYYQALRHHNITAAMHIFPKGGHGWLMWEKVTVDMWGPLVVDWLKEINK